MTSQQAVAIISDAGGKLIGRTRLQKLAYIFEVAGVGSGFPFQYALFGPYSEELNTSLENAQSLKLITERSENATWGGKYSVFETKTKSAKNTLKARRDLARIASNANSIELELAATALFLHKQGVKSPWQETARRKPDKVGGDRLSKARDLYRQLRQVKTPHSLPDF